MANVLVIDDDDAVSAVMKAMLETAEHRVVLCAVPAEAYDKLQRERFDLIVSDAHFPGIAEMEVLAKVRRLDPVIPVILATGGSTQTDMAEAVSRFGVHVVLSKPFTRRDLLRAVEGALPRREA
jgi:two-component system C4-dicarboxylate transport response regulator DctD